MVRLLSLADKDLRGKEPLFFLFFFSTKLIMSVNYSRIFVIVLYIFFLSVAQSLFVSSSVSLSFGKSVNQSVSQLVSHSVSYLPTYSHASLLVSTHSSSLFLSLSLFLSFSLPSPLDPLSWPRLPLIRSQSFLMSAFQLGFSVDFLRLFSFVHFHCQGYQRDINR